MNLDKNDIEYILLHKTYSELTNEELRIVGEVLKTEEAYNEFRYLLQSIAAEDDVLEPNPTIKEKLIKDFEKARWQKGVAMQTETKVIPIKENTDKRKYLTWFAVVASVLLAITLWVNNSEVETKQLAVAELKEEPKYEKKTEVKEVSFDLKKEEESKEDKEKSVLPSSKLNTVKQSKTETKQRKAESNSTVIALEKDPEPMMSSSMQKTKTATNNWKIDSAEEDKILASCSISKDKELLDILFTAL